MSKYKIPWFAWKIINPIREWLHRLDPIVSVVVSILTIVYTAYITWLIPGMTLLAVFYSLLVLVVALTLWSFIIPILSYIIPEDWVDRYVAWDIKLKKNLKKGGFE